MAAGTVTLDGRAFPVADKVPLIALLRFAHVAQSGVDTEDMEALDAIYGMLKACFQDEVWNEFQNYAAECRADTEELLAVVKDAMNVISARPTVSPSDSSDGQTATSTSSSESSFSLEFSQEEPATPAPTEEQSPAPLLRDPRVLELVPVAEAARRLRVA